MSFAQPYLLLSLLAPVALLAAYLWRLRRRHRRAVRYSNVALVRVAVGNQRRWRRHVPIALVLASLGLLGVASSRPQVRADVPVTGAAVILALDVSGSMCSTDVSPNRLSAAQEAVRKFIRLQDDQTRIGLVLFSGFAQLAVAPTNDRDQLLQAVDGLTTGRGTTIGAAILKSIDAIAELDANVARSDASSGATGSGADRPSGIPTGPGGPPTTKAPTAPEIVVLLTDGANTRGVSPQDAATQAAARGIRVYPIGFGTTTPSQLVCTSDQLGGLVDGSGGGGFGGGPGGFGGRNPLLVDEGALRAVAETTGGEYFKATDAEQLNTVLADLRKHVTVEQQDIEISAGFVALAAVLLLAGLWLSLRRSTFPQ
ncbi:MAG: VWA domain-containing protein [Actinomycetota bacterium]